MWWTLERLALLLRGLWYQTWDKQKDYLVETLGGDPTPGVGWALGMERVRMLLGEAESTSPLVFVVYDDTVKGLELATKIRRAGYSCELDFPPQGSTPRKIQKQMERANKSGAAFTVIRWEKEVNAGTVAVKNMAEHSQIEIPVEELIEFLRKNSGKSV
jgi:histidyl-tRNA synthetase